MFACLERGKLQIWRRTSDAIGVYVVELPLRRASQPPPPSRAQDRSEGVQRRHHKTAEQRPL